MLFNTRYNYIIRENMRENGLTVLETIVKGTSIPQHYSLRFTFIY